MRALSNLLLLCAAIVVHAGALAQDAGRLLVAAGEVTILRDNQRLPAATGMPVRSGDTLQLGARSNAQVRFSDESIVALRSDTEFRVAQYQFNPDNAESGQAFFRLLKGGMRTITGLIGRRNQQNYGVSTATATIGIRGTHFTLVECVQSCRNPDGSLAPDGSYGTVSDGRIGVTNKSAECASGCVFGVDQVFHVASAEAAPRPLVAPPSFLRDALEGRARAQERGQAAGAAPAAGQRQPAQAQVAQQQAQPSSAPATTAPTGDIRTAAAVSNVQAAAPIAAVLTTNVFQSTNEFATTGPATVVEPSFGGTVQYRINGPFNIPVTCSGSFCPAVVAGRIGLSVNFALQRAVVSTTLLTAAGTMFNLSTPLNTLGFPITVEGGQAVFSGTLDRSDPLFAEQTGSFRCSHCGPGGTPGFVDQISVRGTISGDTASIQLGAVDATGAAAISATLPKVVPPNESAAAIVLQACTANCTASNPTVAGATATSSSHFGVALDGSGRLLQFGVLDAGGTGPSNALPGSVGRLTADVGTASNVIIGSDAAAGNLVWGRWVGPGARITDGSYVAYTSGTNQRQPWITGDLPNTLPPSLGNQTYTLISSPGTPGGFAAAFSNNTSRVNSATLNADFVNRLMTLSVNVTNAPSQLNSTNTNTYQSTGSSGISPITGRFSAGFSSTTCTGPCNGGVGRADGSFSGFFSGAQAQGAAVALTVGFGANANSTTGAGVSAVIGLKR